jgi:outer membrane biosynthesis protein TonB
VIDEDDMHHLVNGLSLEVARQAERLRRRSHGQDWPGAASAMGELEEAVEILGRMVNLTLRSTMARPEPESEAAEEEPPTPELPTGQYL